MSPLRCAAAAALALCLAPGPSQAQTAIKVATTAAAPGASMFAAKEEGFFAKRGLDVSLVVMNLMPNFPPALVADSAQVAFMTTTTFLQAVDGGIDLVAFAGGAVSSHRATDTAVLAYNGAGIKLPADFVGRKLGVPGIGAILQVIFRYWLQQNGVDFTKVNYVEVSFQTMRDILVAKGVDAVIATEPFIGQITATGAGYPVAVLNPDLPEGKPLVMYTAMRGWADAHPKEIAAFRAAIVEGAAFVAANPEKTLADINVYAKLPPQILKTITIGLQAPALSAEQVAWWIDVMKQQRMLNGTPDAKTLVLP